MTGEPVRPLGRLLAAGTSIATCVMTGGAVLEATAWHGAARALILASAALFAALPVMSLAVLAVSYRRRRIRLYVVLTCLVILIVTADAVVGGLLGPR